MERNEKENELLFMGASGKLPYTLRNDYVFHTFLLRNNNLLKQLTCALKHLCPEEVKSVTILNPIAFGKTIESKKYILDIKVLLNDDSIINYEMQVINEKDWPERSLLYLCREFDDLNRGDEYSGVKAVTHIGFLDFTLFSEEPELYATYRLMNVKTNHLYTDKFTLSVLDLTKIHLATEEDREWHIEKWAALFAAETWEEIKELAEGDEVMTEAAKAIYKIVQDTEEQRQARAREDWLRLEKMNKAKIKELEEEVERLKKLLEEKNN